MGSILIVPALIDQNHDEPALHHCMKLLAVILDSVFAQSPHSLYVDLKEKQFLILITCCQVYG